MQLLTEIKNISYTQKNLKYFGYILSGILIVFSYSAYRNDNSSLSFTYFALSIILAAITTMNPLILKLVYKYWMIGALTLGMAVSFIMMSLIYIFAFCTTGLIGKIFGKKFLLMHIDKKSNTYWLDKKNIITKESYDKQY